MAEQRGSQRLLDAWSRGAGGTVDEKFVQSLAKSLREYEFHHILIKGIPRPDFLDAMIDIPGDDPERCGIGVKLILEALRAAGIVAGHVRVFPYGIPQDIEGWRVSVQVGAGEAWEAG